MMRAVMPIFLWLSIFLEAPVVKLDALGFMLIGNNFIPVGLSYARLFIVKVVNCYASAAQMNTWF